MIQNLFLLMMWCDWSQSIYTRNVDTTAVYVFDRKSIDGYLTHWLLGDSNEILVFLYFSYLNLAIHGLGVSYEIAHRWMPLILTDDESTLLQEMAWSHQATSHYLIKLTLAWDGSPPQKGPPGIEPPQNGVAT